MVGKQTVATCGCIIGWTNCCWLQGVHNCGKQGGCWHGNKSGFPWQQTTGGWWLIGVISDSCIVGIVGAGGKSLCLINFR